jgi:hypothetical protein
MAKRRGNPIWGKPPLVIPFSLSTFECVVRKLQLSPDQYESSIELREWARRNRKNKYVPSELLQAWGLHVETEVRDKHLDYSLRLRSRRTRIA